MRLAAGLALAFLLTSAPLQAGEVFTARVTAVIDGDTIDAVRGNETLDLVRVRLYGLDAPESGQAHGKKAAAHLRGLVNKQLVRVEIMQQKDRYGRIVGIVRLDGRDAGLDLATAGYAWVDERFCRRADPCDEYRAAASRARKGRAGLWRDKAVEPWAWR